MDSRNTFTINELYFLSNVFECQIIPCLPSILELTNFSVDDEEIFQSLVQKNVFDNKKELTEYGFVVIETLKQYTLSKEFTVLNNLLIGFDEKDSAIVLVQTVSGTYMIFKLNHILKVKFLLEKFSIFLNRTPRKDELNFLYECSVFDEDFIEKMLESPMIFIESYKKEYQDRNLLKMNTYSFFLMENSIYGMIDEDRKIYRISQFYMLERLYNFLKIPFDKEGCNNEASQYDFK